MKDAEYVLGIKVLVWCYNKYNGIYSLPGTNYVRGDVNVDVQLFLRLHPAVTANAASQEERYFVRRAHNRSKSNLIELCIDSLRLHFVLTYTPQHCIMYIISAANVVTCTILVSRDKMLTSCQSLVCIVVDYSGEENVRE